MAAQNNKADAMGSTCDGQPPAGAINQSVRLTIHEQIAMRISGAQAHITSAENFTRHLRVLSAMLPVTPTAEQEEALHQFFSI